MAERKRVPLETSEMNLGHDPAHHDTRARMALSEMNAADPLDKFNLKWIYILGEHLYCYKSTDFNVGYRRGQEHERDKPWWKRLFNLDA